MELASKPCTVIKEQIIEPLAMFLGTWGSHNGSTCICSKPTNFPMHIRCVELRFCCSKSAHPTVPSGPPYLIAWFTMMKAYRNKLYISTMRKKGTVLSQNSPL